jgi:hypothetical protein
MQLVVAHWATIAAASGISNSSRFRLNPLNHKQLIIGVLYNSAFLPWAMNGWHNIQQAFGYCSSSGRHFQNAYSGHIIKLCYPNFAPNRFGQRTATVKPN